ncbi:transcription initiation factor TFIID subunit 12 [Diaporthe amygdali]|uniref:transcription initiation factor TFIID subunit 12 n=1 Tax=Phomopsis amygdali TaxID=1214568 RepID=UPI0022FEAC3F|nr:transcription initiation factor TFIID subunit 12 [Diaporthe amygdali]KAJ0117226.1 transcription initiation factor TFIID subunit 12 [Diaporthe amygdali]
MNPNGQPGQAAQGGPAGNTNPGSQPNAGIRMFRPEQMRNIPQLSPEEKVKYENGLRQLWGALQNAAPGSPQQREAQKKIADFSHQLVNKMRQRMPANQGQQGQNSQAGNSQNPGAADGSASGAAGSQPSQATATTGPTSTPAQPQGQAPRPASSIQQHLEQMTWIPPQEVVDQGPEAAAKWSASNKEKYQRAMLQMQSTTERLKNNENLAKTLSQKGAAMTPEEQKSFQSIQAQKPQVIKAYQDAKRFVEEFRKAQTERKAGAQTANAQARPQSNGGVVNANANPPPRPGPSPQQPAVPNSVDAAKNQQANAAGGVTGANGQTGQQQPQPPTQPPKVTASAAPQASPVPTTQPAPGPSSQPIKVEPGTQQHPHPPPVNTAIASASAAGVQTAGTPTQVRTPQTATPVTGAPRSLSHQAALSLANQRGSQAGSLPGPAPQQTTPQGPGGTPLSAPGVMGTVVPQPGHPHAHPQTQQPQPLTQNSKLPIPKQLPEKAAAPPQPVSLSAGGVTPGRPTYTGGGGIAGGVMGNPVLPKLPVVQMEGEGERVLNRKKLDDLVRQVCGGQAEGQEGNVLTPDVEESILHLADTFVDRLLHSACNNAKQRGSKVLEIRDIQLVLERTYNIRIPGYSSDELRTVRKVQPAQGWITKMSAIQAAKVMPGKGDL